MMTCTDCKAATETAGRWRRYNCLKCQWCAARLIQQIGRQPIPKAQASERMTAVLADAAAHGQDEVEIRALVAVKAMAAQPVEIKAKK